MEKISIETGIDVLTNSQPQPSWLKNKRLGILLNPASVSKNLLSSADLINEHFPGQLKALFTPQHGYHAAKQDNMIESSDLVHPKYNIPIFSLYGKTRVPLPHMMNTIDTLLIDIQDVGTRVYTFIYTLSYCMEAAKANEKTVVVLDRPNPISGDRIEGNCLENECQSFVGRYPIPMRHGLTIAEFARYINEIANIHCDLKVIPMNGWKRNMYYDQTDLTWVAPSPNMPTVNTAMVYPGQVIFEGTNISEGRGTTQPFEIFGAPFIETDLLIKDLDHIPGIYLRPLSFEPTFNKWKETLCQGFQIHITNRNQYNSYETSLRLLQSIIRRYPNDFQWKHPPYEYELKKMPIDLILGSKQLRQSIERGQDLELLKQEWQPLTSLFEKQVKKFLLYE
ncbi:MAG: hypothetical protein OMM_05184 [Candidatus Magnetoglobus multicellularis str. Araruama]|uniref:DUF1343 domain-containing protein n=1 Tax=Candidatus Magnetoglobus multicellularis str. Araruama TaxID=890399 RepID=A0A1V1NXR9_9BACT|nr:MAG: hypothetical protein OMM_05184 [Candidatus Magnetoglobus multicellularis str. Araruama]